MTAPAPRTVADAFAAGWNAACEHGRPDPAACDDCRLTPAEIGRLAVLLGGIAKRTPVPAPVGRLAA
ncbi:hypothetical protein ACIQU5_28150 [Streptomyces sp. NPDC090306]|uniref:hypothetical protein n=1 Tax=Streptomyces sp. NPDC090306 TaxID=3365961 RepID=UPI0037FCEF1D